MRLFERDANRPGKPVFIAGIIVYLAALAACLIAIGFGIVADWSVLAYSLSLPLLLPVGLAGLSWTVFFVGTITGTPLVSFTYALSQARHNWRGLAGVLLLVAALLTAIALFISYSPL